MAAGKEQRNNERERAGTSEKVERSRRARARLPNGLARFAGDLVLHKGPMGCAIAAAEPW
jgi:hypothetical protein